MMDRTSSAFRMRVSYFFFVITIWNLNSSSQKENNNRNLVVDEAAVSFEIIAYVMSHWRYWYANSFPLPFPFVSMDQNSTCYVHGTFFFMLPRRSEQSDRNLLLIQNKSKVE